MSRLEKDCNQRMRYREEHIDDILSLLHPQLTKPLKDCTLLDMGCGMGGLSIPASPRVKRVKGIDINELHVSTCIDKAKERGLMNTSFQVMSLFDFEEEDAYDIVLCSDVLEHVKDQHGVLEKVVSTLKDGGVFYLTTNNKYWPMEGHFGLLFLSYQSRESAERRIRRRRRGKVYNVYPLSYRELKGLLSRFPVEYELKPPKNPATPMYRLGAWLVRRSPFFWNFSNAFQVIGKKRSSNES